jgi:hypothetical protein
LATTRLFLFASWAYERIGTPKPIQNRVAVLGDETALLYAFHDTKLGPIVAYPIPSLTIMDVASSSGSFVKTAFWNRIEEMDGYEWLILCLGMNDMVSTVPMWLMRERKVRLSEIFEGIVGKLNEVLLRIKEKWGNLKFAIHSMFFESDAVDRKITKRFCEVLRKGLPEWVRYVDFGADINSLITRPRKDGKENGGQLAVDMNNCLSALE